MSLNEHYEVLSEIAGEPVRKFMDRYYGKTGQHIPSKYEMTHYYGRFIEMSILDIRQRREAEEWCIANFEVNDWYNVNSYFMFTTSDDATLFKLAFCSERSLSPLPFNG
jgi:hypothetical protein